MHDQAEHPASRTLRHYGGLLSLRRVCIHPGQIPGEGGKPRNVLALGRLERLNAQMSDHIYKKIELVGSSQDGIEDAVNNAISRAGKTIRNMGWFEVAEVRGHIENNRVAHWQVTVKVGFTLDD
jgi:dodecin